MGAVFGQKARGAWFRLFISIKVEHYFEDKQSTLSEVPNW
jgi:hypothetical protein